MAMSNPPHPGRSIRENCLDPLGLNVTEAAKVLGVARPTLSRVLNGHAAISSEMAIRLEKAGWSNAEFWLRRQTTWDLVQGAQGRRPDQRRAIPAAAVGVGTALTEYAALPHTQAQCESSSLEPTSALFASSCRKRSARKWRRQSLPILAVHRCSVEPEVFASCGGKDRDGESGVESERFTSIM